VDGLGGQLIEGTAGGLDGPRLEKSVRLN
jgi:hypothetical protein